MEAPLGQAVPVGQLAPRDWAVPVGLMAPQRLVEKQEEPKGLEAIGKLDSN